jgi:hypothetical protein
MAQINGIEFSDSIAGLVQRLVDEVERLAGAKTVYPVGVPELRGAIAPGVNGFNAMGCFIRIAPRVDGALVSHKGAEPMTLTEDTLPEILSSLPKWIDDGRQKKAVLTKSSKQAKRAASQAVRDTPDG